MNSMSVTTALGDGRISVSVEGEGLWRDGVDEAQKSDWWRRVAAGENTYFVDYDQPVDVPPSIAVVPFLANILPLAWLTDTTVFVDEIDAHFAAALPLIKARYAHLYPELEWKGGVVWNKLTYRHVGQPMGSPLALFSGGVDAVFTALANIELQPTLVTVWGADMFFHDVPGWERVRQANQEFADRLGLDFMAVTSSLRTSVNYSYLDPTFAKPVKDNWWHAFQFGPSLSSLGLPAAFARGTDTVFLASDYSKKDPYINRSASDTGLVQELRAAGCGVKCHDFAFSRQDKVRFICRFGEERPGLEIPLRVCWQSGSAGNCGKCEKCMRTEFAIMGCDSDPEAFGFDLSAEKQEQIIEVIRGGNFAKTAFWREILSDLRQSKFKDREVVRVLLEAQS